MSLNNNNNNNKNDLTGFLPHKDASMSSLLPTSNNDNHNAWSSSNCRRRADRTLIQAVVVGFLLATVLTLIASRNGRMEFMRMGLSKSSNRASSNNYNHQFHHEYEPAPEQMPKAEYDNHDGSMTMMMEDERPHGKGSIDMGDMMGCRHQQQGTMGGGCMMMMGGGDGGGGRMGNDPKRYHHHGRHGMMGMSRYMETIHHLLDSADDQLIQRQVHKDETTGTIATRTTSADPQTAAWIQEHVWGMLELMEQQRRRHGNANGRMIRNWDPLFAQLYRHANEIIQTAENIDGLGVQVLLKGTTPCGKSLAELHAQAVNTFVQGGWDAAHLPHEPSDQCD